MASIALNLGTNLEAALTLIDLGLSVIPLRERSKAPAITSWKEFQTRRPSSEEVHTWFDTHPRWNVGLVCGAVSGVSVIDIDGEEGEVWFKEQGLEFPNLWQRTSGPHKCHLIYRHPGAPFQVRPSVDTTVKVDVRGDGSYIAFAPSIHPNGSPYRLYAREDLPLESILSGIPLMPSIFVSTPSDSLYTTQSDAKERHTANRAVTYSNAEPQNDVVQGERNSTLTSMCGTWYGRGNSLEEVLFLAQAWNATHCDPPLSEQEVETVVRSMSNTHGNNNPDAFNAGGIISWLNKNEGEFTTDQLYRDMGVKFASDKAKLRDQLNALISRGVIERCGEKAGSYRKVNASLDYIDLNIDEGKPMELWLPFGLEKMVHVYPGNVIVVAGETNSGKTSLLLSIAAYNWKTKVRYLSSEMTPQELKTRLNSFGIPMNEWLAHCEFIQRSDRFADAIDPDAMNIIDFLEMSDNFYKANLYITEIFKRLRGGIAIIAIQKKRGELFGRGGEFTLEKARLGLSLFCHGHLPHGLIGSCLVTKAKNVIGNNNPQDRQVFYQLKHGVEYDLSPIASCPTMKSGLAWYNEASRKQLAKEFDEYCKAAQNSAPQLEVSDAF